MHACRCHGPNVLRLQTLCGTIASSHMIGAQKDRRAERWCSSGPVASGPSEATRDALRAPTYLSRTLSKRARAGTRPACRPASSALQRLLPHESPHSAEREGLGGTRACRGSIDLHLHPIARTLRCSVHRLTTPHCPRCKACSMSHDGELSSKLCAALQAPAHGAAVTTAQKRNRRFAKMQATAAPRPVLRRACVRSGPMAGSVWALWSLPGAAICNTLAACNVQQ